MTKSKTTTTAKDAAKGHAVEDTIRAILSDLLGLPADQVAAMTRQTELFGALPELDSMAVAGLLTELEDRLDITIDDEDVDAELFETFGSLLAFAKRKLAD
jgi:acyl carrier protein